MRVELEREFGTWLTKATTLRDQDRARIAKLVRAQMLRGADADKAARLRVAIKRLTDAFTWGAPEEDDYRAQLADLRAQLGRVEQLPEERRILEATQMATDFASTWSEASPEVQRRITWRDVLAGPDRAGHGHRGRRPERGRAALRSRGVFRFDAAVPTGVCPDVADSRNRGRLTVTSAVGGSSRHHGVFPA